MINAAIVMGVQEVVDIVKGILSNPTMENVNLYTSIIKRVGLDISLLDQEKIYRHGFTDLKQNSVFLGICVDEFEGILMDPEVMVTNEAETVEMIISWIQYNYLQRIGFLDQLLRHVSFECIPPADLVALSEKYSHIFETNAGNSFLCQAFKYHALHSRLPCVPTEGTQHIDEMKPSDNISNISNISQESKRQASEDNQSPKEYLPEEGLTAIKTTLWGPQTPTEPDSFVPPGRTSDPTSATNNRSPPTATRSSSSTPAANNGTQSGTS
ncbi:unnamed protein product [Candidula unifasciata]|uniref:BACK domain-containing protein n=1 Tax=Candidula unifasciata TaxID=100452 RepID=A0A8S3YNU9_9EUPU|nr:unnamed protein product [Candidula unifasciata]